MEKVAFIFPGQGSQFIGMGEDFYNNFKIAKETFEEASDVLNLSIDKICFEGPDDKLRLTENTQPAILTTSIAILRVINKEFDITCNMSAGLSLGEYSALVSSNIINFSDAVQLVKKRGLLMQNAVPSGKGKMAALIGASRANVFSLCEDFSKIGILEPANFNCPGQIVIGGEVAAVNEAIKNIKKYDIKKAMELPVSAPFHTSMLKPASEKFERDLNNVILNKGYFPVISNVTGEIHDEAFIKKMLLQQIYSPVMWEDSINNMISLGVDTFIELGPKKSLSSFVKKIDRSLNILNVQDLKSLNKSFIKLGVAS